MSLKPTLNIARPQLNATRNDDQQNDQNNNNNNNNIISPHDSFDNLQNKELSSHLGEPREQILKTFAFPGNPMTTSEFKNCLMKKRLGELNRDDEISEEEEEEENEEEEAKLTTMSYTGRNVKCRKRTANSASGQPRKYEHKEGCPGVKPD